MASHFRTLKIKSVKKETPNAVVLTFDIPPEWQEEFLFLEGQNITIRRRFGNDELRRNYSICSAPYEKVLKVAVKKIDGGLFSTFANNDLKAGDEVEVLPPTGRFSAKLSGDKAVRSLAIAAGSGITPIISILKHSLQQNDKNTFTLVYGNTDRSNIIFFEELEELKNKYMDRFQLIHMLSRERTDIDLNHGRITPEKLGRLSPLINYHGMDAIYLCGPGEMIFSCRQFLEDRGVDTARIHFELFTTPGQKHTSIQKTAENSDSKDQSSVSIRLDGRLLEFRMPRAGISVLDAALQHKADLPFACKGGVCATCRAKLLTGAVRMDNNYALEKEEVAQGFILTCQSHPITEEISVDFDTR